MEGGAVEHNFERDTPRDHHQQIWLPRAILVSDWLLFKKIFYSETAWQNGAKLGRKHLCKILYKAILKGTHPGTIYARFGPYIDASCQAWLHLAKLFQRRNFFLTLANQKKELISKSVGDSVMLLCKIKDLTTEIVSITCTVV
jgi:hypothetical protein